MTNSKYSFFLLSLIPALACSTKEPAQNTADYATRSTDNALLNKQGARSKTKTKLDELNAKQGWIPAGNDLWMNSSGALGYRTEDMGETGPNIVRFQTVDCDKKTQLKDAIDFESFRKLGANFYQDKERIFHYRAMAYGGVFCSRQDIDREAFQVKGCYAWNKSAVYTETGVTVPEVDILSFRTRQDIGCFGKDKHSYFRWEHIFSPTMKLDKEAHEAMKKLRQL